MLKTAHQKLSVLYISAQVKKEDTLKNVESHTILGVWKNVESRTFLGGEKMLSLVHFLGCEKEGGHKKNWWVLYTVL